MKDFFHMLWSGSTRVRLDENSWEINNTIQEWKNMKINALLNFLEMILHTQSCLPIMHLLALVKHADWRPLNLQHGSCHLCLFISGPSSHLCLDPKRPRCLSVSWGNSVSAPHSLFPLPGTPSWRLPHHPSEPKRTFLALVNSPVGWIHGVQHFNLWELSQFM